jgi:curli biogenesis system outer membrane secretion channel CsgG
MVSAVCRWRVLLTGGYSVAALSLLAWQPGYCQLPPGAVAPGEQSADFKPVEVDSEGSGASADAAIAKALSNATAEQTGVSVGAATLSGSVNATATDSTQSNSNSNSGMSGVLPPSMRVRQDDKTTTESLNGQGAASAVISTSGGRVLRYHVISVAAAPGGGFTAKVHAVLQLFQRQSGVADSRKRIAISAFALDDPRRSGGNELGQALHDQLVIDLTQSRRFAVVDRADDADYQQEMAIVNGGDAAPAERAHAGQVLGADFILTGKLHEVGSRTTGHGAITSSNTIELTGEVVSHTTASTLRTVAGSATASYELIEVATRQIIMADRSTVSGNEVTALAQRMTDTLLNTIYPPRLIKADDPNDLIINEGGTLLHAGQHFRLMIEGEEMFDPYTHESLGKTERQGGVVEVVDVEPRMSHARLVSGDLPPTALAGVLRPVAEITVAAQGGRRRVVVRRTVSQTAPADASSGGLKLPFDH